MDYSRKYRGVADDGRSIELEYSDWWSLLGRAHEFGWSPVEGLDYYRKDVPDVIPPDVAATIADALRESIKDLPMKRTEPDMVAGSGGMSVVHPAPLGPGDDYRLYFAGERHGRVWMVGEFIGLCDQSGLEITRSTH